MMFQEIPFGDRNLQKIAPHFYRTEKNMISVTGKLGEKSRTKFSCKDSDIGSYIINCFIENKTYFEVMDAISTVRNFGWNRTQQYTYQLDDSLDEYEKVFKRVDNFDKERSDAALPFMDFVDRLSNEEKNNLKNNSRGIPFRNLPKNIQKSLSNVANILEKQYPKSKGLEFRLSSGSISIETPNSAGFRHFMIIFNVPGTSISISVHDFETWKAQRSIIGEKQSRLDYKKSKVTTSSWARSLEGKKKVSFQGYASPEEILLDIARQYKVDILCDSKKMWKKSANFSVKEIPMSEFLDILVDKFPKTEWEIRESGIIVVRGSKNPYHLLQKPS
jgi:hypothetical protein